MLLKCVAIHKSILKIAPFFPSPFKFEKKVFYRLRLSINYAFMKEANMTKAYDVFIPKTNDSDNILGYELFDDSEFIQKLLDLRKAERDPV